MIKKYKPNSLQELQELVSDKSVHLGDIDTSLITDMTELFKDSTRKNFDGLETWDTSNVTTMERMFHRAKYFNHPIGNWDVSSVTNMECIFCGCSNFNQPLGDWDVSSVTNMESMFGTCGKFNQPLNDWDVSKVRKISCMFCEAESFNQPLDRWNTSEVREMSWTFAGCTKFNQDISSWDTSNATVMEGVFERAARFNQPLNTWNVSNVRDMFRMFEGAKSFNQPLDQWNVSRVENMERMFKNARSFSQPLDMWLIPRFCDVNNMFLSTPLFTDVKTLTLCFFLTTKKNCLARLKEKLNGLDPAEVYKELSRYYSVHTTEYMSELEAAHPELIGSVSTNVGDVKRKPRSKRELIELLDMGAKMPLADIDTSLITDMEGLFRKSKRSNFAGIETWDTSNVVTMKHMFAAAIHFNHDISGWNVSNVRDMSYMFEGAHRFNKPLDGWNVSSVRNMRCMFLLCPLLQSGSKLVECLERYRHGRYVPLRLEFQPEYSVVGRLKRYRHGRYVLPSGAFQPAYRRMECFRCHEYETDVLEGRGV